MVNWGEEGILPNMIWGFVDLSDLNTNCRVNYGGIRLTPGIYAVVENAAFVQDEEECEMSELFVPIEKFLAGTLEDIPLKLQFFLADVEAIVEPIAVVPDLGGPPNRYFQVKERDAWRNDFINFLEKDFDIDQEITDDEEGVESDN